jgi:hypothetical protein
MSETYRKEINERKARSFFKHILKNDCAHLVNPKDQDLLADILTKRLLEKLEREKR